MFNYVAAATTRFFLVANAVWNEVEQATKAGQDGILNRILKGIFGYIGEVVESAVTTVTNVFLAPLGMDLRYFREIFVGADRFYNVILWTGVIIATMILVWKLFTLLTLKKEGEHPAKLVARYALTIFVMFASTAIFDHALSMAQRPYNQLKIVQYRNDGVYANAEDDGVEENKLTTLSGSALSSDIKTITGKIVSMTADAAGVGFGGVAAIILLIVMFVVFSILIVWNFIKLLIECIERYVVLGVLYFTAPLPLAAGVSEETRQIRDSWIRMCVSQILIIFLSMWFIRGFAWGMGQATLKIVFQPQYAVFYLGMLLAFLKIGQHIDEYMGILGLSTARTGGQMLDDLAVVKTLGHTIKDSIKSGRKTASGSDAKRTDAASVYNPIDPRKTAATASGGRAASQFTDYMGLSNMRLSNVEVSKGRASAVNVLPDGTKQTLTWRKASEAETSGARKLARNETPIIAKDGSKNVQTTHTPANLLATQKGDLNNISMHARKETGLDLSHGQLTDVNMDSAELKQLNVSGGNLKDSRANGADLREMRAEHTVFDHFTATGSQMQGMHAPDSHIRDSDFSRSDLTGMVASNGEFTETNMTGAICRGMDMSNASALDNNMTGIAAGGINAAHSSWSGNTAHGGDFSGSDFSYVRGQNNSFEDAFLNNANCHDWHMDSSNFNGLHAQGIKMENGVLTGDTTMFSTSSGVTDFHLGDFTNATWSGVKGENVNMEQARLFGAHFENCDLKKFSFAGALFDENTSFAGSDLSGSNFAGISRRIFGKINFSGSNLTGCIMPDGMLFDPTRDYGNPTIL